jgi:geranylgeranylglycerol-phosphate geranylgeranyltransferase
LQITRPSSSLLTFLSVLIPVFVRTGDFSLSFRRSVPLLFVSMCTFIANDLDDADKDRINHPDRPLASGRLAPATAAVAYFASLMFALLSTRFYVGTSRIAFLYYVMLATWISYHYVVEYLPVIKPVYVAAVATLPVTIVAAFYPTETALRRVVIVLFLFALGRELCKDLPDRAGDPKSPLHFISAQNVARFAFSVQVIGLGFLTFNVKNILGIVLFITMTVLLVTAGLFWFRSTRFLAALRLMQAILFLGLYFLL